MKDNKFPEDQELDLKALKQKMNDAMDNFSTKLFRMLQFFIKNIIVIAILFILGVGLGFYVDRTQKTYDHELTVQPNFGSVEFLYTKINLIESKIEKGDTNYLKNVVGIKYPKKLLKIEVKPMVDIYQLANRSESNFELLKVMAEDGSFKKVIEDPATAVNYPVHVIYLRTKDAASRENTIDPLVKFLNTGEHYAKMKVLYQQNLEKKVEANQRTITQIDGILDRLGAAGSGSAQVNVNQDSQLNDVIETKDRLVREQADLSIAKLNYDKIVKDQSLALNIDNTEVTTGKMKLFLPILFIGFFVIIKLFIAFYKKQSAKAKA